VLGRPLIVVQFCDRRKNWLTRLVTPLEFAQLLSRVAEGLALWSHGNRLTQVRVQVPIPVSPNRATG